MFLGTRYSFPNVIVINKIDLSLSQYLRFRNPPAVAAAPVRLQIVYKFKCMQE